MIALVTDITPNRATVAAILSPAEANDGEPSDETLDACGLAREGGNASWALVEMDECPEVGERIWRDGHGYGERA